MFSAFRKLTGGGGPPTNQVNGSNGGQIQGGGFHVMSGSLQKKFSKGVHYNMKIILKGDRNSGKSSLFRRLQGLPFEEEYKATEEIELATIQWNYKTTDDVVKVEVWDVVDKAKKKKRTGNKLKIDNSGGNGVDQAAEASEEAEETEEFGLDATFLDVFKGTNGVIFVYDITKSWTWDYVKREIALVPHHIPILILGNHRDMGHHRATAFDTVLYFIEDFVNSGDRPADAAEIRYAESSMRNGFGLKFIHKFFNLPFLHLQRETLLKQIETNKEETQITIQELDYYADSDEAKYDLFIDTLGQKRRQVADSQAQAPKISLEQAQAIAKEREAREAAAAASQPKNIITSSLNNIVSSSSLNTTKIESPAPSPSSSTSSKTSKTGQTILPLPSNKSQSPAIAKSVPRIPNSKPKDELEFVPSADEDNIDSFLEESSPNSTNFPTRNNDLVLTDSDDEDGGGGGDRVHRANPMVASVVEDFVPEKISYSTVSSPPPAPIASQINKSLTSDEEEGPEKEDDEITKEAVKAPIIMEPLDFSIFEQQPTSAKSSETKEKKKKSSKHGHGEKKKKSSHKSKEKRSTALEEFLSGSGAGDSEEVGGAYEAI